MTSYVTPRKNVAYKFYVALVDQSNTKLTKANPTIASGDFKVSTDGGAFANLATLPSANPASGRAVMIDLSSGEMNGDNIVVQCVDAAGAEWCDLILNILTSARQIDDLAFPATSGRSMDTDASGRVLLQPTQPGIAFGTTSMAGLTTNITGTLSTLTTYTGNTPQTGDSFARIGALGAGLTALALHTDLPTNFSAMAITAGGAVTAGTVSDKTGYTLTVTPPTSAQIASAVWSATGDGAYTYAQMLGYSWAFAAGPLSGVSSNLPVFVSKGGNFTISAIQGADGRSSVTLS